VPVNKGLRGGRAAPIDVNPLFTSTYNDSEKIRKAWKQRPNACNLRPIRL